MKKFKNIMMLILVVSLGLGTLAGCGKEEAPETDVVESGEVTEEEDGKVSGDTSLPDEEITLRVMDWSDSSRQQRDDFHEEFMEKYPNVKIEYTLLAQDQYRNTVMTEIKSGNAPDLFPIPSGMQLAQAVKENWHMPLDDYVTDEFLDTIGPGILMEGYTHLDGVLYNLPENAQLAHSFIFYNKDLFEEAGLDPENPPATWGEFREAAKAITEAGDDQYYGIIEGGKQTNRLDILGRAFGNLAGAKVNDTNYVVMEDGSSNFNSPEMIETLNYFKDLVDDGSLHPDTMSISAPEARALFGQGQAGFISQGVWCIPIWRDENPDLNFGVMNVPRPDGEERGSLPQPPNEPWLGIASNSEHPEWAGQYLMELYGESYQGANVKAGAFTSIIPEVNEKYMEDEQMFEYYDIAQTTTTAPDPLKRDPIVNDFYAISRDVQPTFGSIVQAILANSIDDPTDELNKLDKSLTAEWNRAADEVGMDISILEFPNWDPTKDYTDDMYDELD